MTENICLHKFSSFNDRKQIIFMHSNKGGMRSNNQWYYHTLGWVKEYKRIYNIVWITQTTSIRTAMQLSRHYEDLFDGILHINSTKIRESAKTWKEFTDISMRKALEESTDLKNIKGALLFEIYSVYTSWTDNDADTQFLDAVYFEICGPRGGNRSTAYWTRVSEALSIQKFFAVTQLVSFMNMPVLHNVYDPGEQDWSKLDYFKRLAIKYSRVFGYDSEIFNFNRFDNCLYHVMMHGYSTMPKDIDFTLGFSITTDDRLYLRDVIPVFQQLNESFETKLFIQDNRDKDNIVDTRVKRDEYYKYLSRSKYTFVIPAYEKRSFSYKRFLEAFYHSCIPLIWTECNHREFSDTFKLPDELLFQIVCRPEEIAAKIKHTDWKKLLFDIRKYVHPKENVNVDIRRYQ